MDVLTFPSVLTVFHGLASVVAKDPPTWPDAVSVGFEMNSVTGDFGMSAKHYLSRNQKSSRWDINGGANKLFVDYRESDPGMYYYFPVTTGKNKNETACFFLPMTPQNPTAEVPTLLPDLKEFSFVGVVVVEGIKTEKWTNSRGSLSWKWIQNMFIHNSNNSGKIEPVLVQAEFTFYICVNDVRTKLWTHTKTVFNHYEPHEPGVNIWKRPSDLKCKATTVAAAEYLIYLENMHLVLPIYPILNQLFVDEIYYLTSYKDWNQSETVGSHVEDGKLPESWDWKKLGAVTGAKDQGICKSGSWAFGAIGALEGAYFLKTKKLANLSEQALVDCSWHFGNNGCFGGCTENAFRWILENGGVPSTEDYGRFQQVPGYCRSDIKPLAPIKRFGRVLPTVDAVKSAIVKHGPLAAKIAVPYDLHYYTHGVYKSPEREGIEQFVVLIGYGTFDGDPYWLIKNSWSDKWGMSGFGMISADNNLLNLLDSVYYVDI